MLSVQEDESWPIHLAVTEYSCRVKYSEQKWFGQDSYYCMPSFLLAFSLLIGGYGEDQILIAKSTTLWGERRGEQLKLTMVKKTKSKVSF